MTDGCLCCIPTDDRFGSSFMERPGQRKSLHKMLLFEQTVDSLLTTWKENMVRSERKIFSTTPPGSSSYSRLIGRHKQSSSSLWLFYLRHPFNTLSSNTDTHTSRQFLRVIMWADCEREKKEVSSCDLRYSLILLRSNKWENVSSERWRKGLLKIFCRIENVVLWW